jgi:hypothetical protein
MSLYKKITLKSITNLFLKILIFRLLTKNTVSSKEFNFKNNFNEENTVKTRNSEKI